MDIVFIRGLVIETIVGIHDWEKHTPRPVVVNAIEWAAIAQGPPRAIDSPPGADLQADHPTPNRVRLWEPLRPRRDLGGAMCIDSSQ